MGLSENGMRGTGESKSLSGCCWERRALKIIYSSVKF